MTLPTFATSKSVVSRKRLAFLCVLSLSAFLAVFFGWAGRQGLFAISDGKSQTYTELYFISSHDIPERLKAGQTYNVPFAIVNHEGGDRTYSYKVTVTQGADTKTLVAETIHLHNGQRSDRPLSFTPTNITVASHVTVELQPVHQTIDFKVGP